MHVSMINIYDPSTCPGPAPTFQEIKEAVRVSLPVAPSFRRKIARVPMDLDYPYWVEDEDFNLNFHLRHLALPRPGDWAQFRTQVSRLVERPLDLSRPPWEITIIEGLDSLEGLPAGCFALVIKIHHCAIDGKAGVTLVTALHQDSPERMPVELEDDWEPELEPTQRELLLAAWKNSIRRPLKVARLLLSNAPGLLHSAYRELMSDHSDKEMMVPDTRFIGPVSAHRIYDDVTCTLQDLKNARSAVEGATINDVCLTIVGGALRRYLEAKAELPEEPLIAVVPISIGTPEQAAAGGNQVTVMRVSLRTDVEDPIERLKTIAQETRGKKATQSGVVMSTLLDVVYNLPGALVGAASRAVPVIASRTRVANTMVTNVPGPVQPMYFLGARHIYSTGCPPMMDGMGLMHSVCSYEGKFLFSFVACSEMMPDADFYHQCMVDSVNSIKGMARGKTPRKTPQRRRKRS